MYGHYDSLPQAAIDELRERMHANPPPPPPQPEGCGPKAWPAGFLGLFLPFLRKEPPDRKAYRE